MSSPARIVGRYELHAEFASGGMASVYLGRLIGAAGFAKVVAIKRLHPQHVDDGDFVSRLLEEARLSERIRHANVVATLDVVQENRELLLVMEYVHGETLARLLRLARERRRPCPAPVLARIGHDVLSGLAAAHHATGPSGEPLTIVHRDISPQNILVGADGTTRLLDFGIAKAVGSVGHTKEGHLKGKVPYMAPELIRFEPATPLSDLWAVGVVLWEGRTGRRLFRADTDMEAMGLVVTAPIPDPGGEVSEPSALDDVILRALSRDPLERVQEAQEFADAIERAERLASPSEVAAWVRELAEETLEERAALVRRVEAAAPLDVVESTPVTQTVTTQEPPPARGTTTPFFVFALAALSAAVGFLYFRKPEGGVSPTALDAAFVAPAPVDASADAAGGPTREDEARDAAALALATDAGPAAAPDAAALGARDAGVSGRGPRPRGPKPPASGSATASPVEAPPKPDCDPPYSVDEMGRKRFKLECVGK